MEAARDRSHTRTAKSVPRRPKYEQIRDDLAMAIRRGVYRPGDALPSQRDLSASYGVTLMTLRQALQVLSDEGLVVQQPGRGTFVTPRHVARPPQPPGDVSVEVLGQSIELETRVIRYGKHRPSATVRTALNLPGEQYMLRVERLCIVDEIPAFHQTSWAAEQYTESVRGVDFTKVAVPTALAEHAGLSISRRIETVSSALVTTDTARHLNADVGSAAFRSDRVTFDGDEHPIVLDRTIILGGQIIFRVESGVNGKSWNWATVSGGGEERLAQLGFAFP